MTMRCVCAAALERALAQYGHLDGCLVWITRTDHPGSSYQGVLRVLTDRPGYLHLDRGPDTSRTWHIDDIAHVITDQDHEADRQRRTEKMMRRWE